MGPRKELAPWWRTRERLRRELRVTWSRLLLIATERWYGSTNQQRIATMQKKKQADSTEDVSYSLRIEARFGSHFQRSVAIKNLNAALATWKELVEAQHKKNAVTVIRGKD
jgi:uncharacterized protein YmfQ (DUF2313 family)